MGPDRQGGGGAHRPAVGGAVCQAVAGCPAAAARRHPAERDRGTPQGSSVSPVLANLFMHYAFDILAGPESPGVEFERYADDAMVHCATERQARKVLEAMRERMEQVGLRLHPARPGSCTARTATGAARMSTRHSRSWDSRSRPRGPRQERQEVHLVPARDQQGRPEAKISAEVRRWRLHLRTWHTMGGLAREINPVVRGWMKY